MKNGGTLEFLRMGYNVYANLAYLDSFNIPEFLLPKALKESIKSMLSIRPANNGAVQLKESNEKIAPKLSMKSLAISTHYSS